MSAAEGRAPSLETVIVNWNTGQLLRQAIESVAASRRDRLGDVRVTVVDNASSDGSWQSLDDLGVPVKLIRNDRNRGFAAACNQGAAGSTADYLLFLNPDMSLFEDTLRDAVGFLESEAGARTGIAGVRLEDEHGAFTHSAARFPSLRVQLAEASGLAYLFPERVHAGPMRESECLVDREVEHVAGAFFLIRGELFRSLGGFDERFFVYAEECDLALRARQAGWPSRYLAGVRARHLGGRSTRQVKSERLFFLLRSRTQYFDKHYSPAVAALHVALSCTLEPASRLIHSLIPSTESGPTNILAAYRSYVGWLIRGGRSRSAG